MAVDNAARGVMRDIIEKYEDKHPGADPIVATRDPQHTVDLLSKDSATTKTMKEILEKAKKVVVTFGVRESTVLVDAAECIKTLCSFG